MLGNRLLTEACDLAIGLASADFNSDQSGDWINVALAESVAIVLVKPAGTAGDDPSFKLEQAQDAAGTGAKALTFDRLHYKKGTTGTFTEKTFTATDDLDLGESSAGAGDLALDDSAGLVVVEVPAAAFDIDNDFTYVRYVNEGDDFANATTCTVLYILKGCDYRRNPRTFDNLA